MKSTRMITKQTLYSLSLAFLIFACAKPAEEETNAVAGSKPSDSQGLAADVQLKFDSSAAATALTAGLDLGTGVVIDVARVNIGKIKIKPEEDEDESELEQESEIKSMREARKAEMEDATKAIEQDMEALKKSYEEQMDSAATDAEKDTLEAEMKTKLGAMEATMAAQHKAVEDEIDAYEEQQDADLKWKGSYVYDLIANSVSPAIPSVTVLDGTYRRIEFELKPNRTLEATDPLLNHSVYVAGSVTLNGTAVPFTYALRLSEEFKIAGPNGANVQPDVVNALVISFNPSLWFTGIDFSGATQDASGTIVVDENNNTAILDSVKELIKSSAKFGEDDDGDGELEEGESSADAQE